MQMLARRPVRRSLVTAATAVIATLTACGGGDSPTGPSESSIVGVYAMQSVNGGGLPSPPAGPDQLQILNGQLSINPDGSYTNIVDYRWRSGTTVVTDQVQELGSYSVNGTAVTFRPTTGNVYTGNVSGRTITLIFTGVTIAYRR